MNTLKAQPAEAQARMEKVKLTRLFAFVLIYTKKPKAKFTKNANDKNIFWINNFKS